MGVRIVEGICRKYQGSFRASAQDGTFETVAMLIPSAGGKARKDLSGAPCFFSPRITPS